MPAPEHARLRRLLVLYGVLCFGAALVAIPAVLMAIVIGDPLTSPLIFVLDLPAFALFWFGAANVAKTRRQLRDLAPPTARVIE